MKLPIDTVRNEFINRGHIPVFDTYNHTKEQLEYYCKCGNPNVCSITLDNLKKGADNCFICSKKKRKKTNNQKYGTDYPIQSKNVKDKIKENNLEKYGVEYPAQSKKIYQKVKQTTLQRYGVENANQSNVIKEKKKKNNLEKYGVEHHMQNKQISDKVKQTNVQKYGVEMPLMSNDIREKIKQTNIEKYGVEYPLCQLEEIKEKSKQTILKKYGVPHVSQCKEIFERQQLSGFRRKPFIFPDSNEIIQVQGYEPFCLNDLLQNEHITENDLLDGYENMPTIKYSSDDKIHCYYPDIYIPSKNLIIEVKSIYTYERYKEINLIKLEATKQNGYNIEIRIYNEKGKCIKKIY